MNSMFRQNSSDRGGQMMAFCIGLAIGGAAIVLWKPMRGRAIQRRLTASAQLGREAISERVSKTAEAAHSIVNQAKDVADRGINAVEARVSSVVGAAPTA